MNCNDTNTPTHLYLPVNEHTFTRDLQTRKYPPHDVSVACNCAHTESRQRNGNNRAQLSHGPLDKSQRCARRLYREHDLRSFPMATR